MATNLQTSKLQALLKNNYGELYAEILFKNAPLLGMLPRSQEYGKLYVNSVGYGSSQNQSADFATAIGNDSQGLVEDYQVPWKEYFAQIFVNHKEMKASENKSGAFMKAFDFEMRLAMDNYRKEVSTQLFRSSKGYKGVVGSVTTPVADNVIVLSQRGDVVQFSVGMNIIASPNADGSSPRDSGTSKEIQSIDHRTGKITLDGAIASIAADDYLFLEGNASNLMNGILDWIPDVASRDAGILSTSFLSVDRSIDSAQLAGHAVDGSGSTFQDALIDAENELRWFGASPDVVIINPLSFREFAKELGSKETVERTSKVSENFGISIGYSNIRIAGCDAEIVLDSHAPVGKAFFLSLDTWKLVHMGSDLVNKWDADGLQLLRSPTKNGINARFVSYHNLVCEAPAKNLVLDLPS